MQEQKRHILLMSSWFPTRLDPFAGNFVQRFGTLLSQEYEVSVIHTMGDKSVKRLELIDEIIDGVRTVIVYHPVSLNKFNHWWNQRKALRKALRLVEDVDLLFAHVLLPRGLQFVKAKFYYNCPMIVLEHASYYRKTVRKRLTQFQKTILKRTSRYIKQVFAVSEVLASDMKALFPTTKIEIIPNFVEKDFFPAKTNFSVEKKRFLHVSTLDRLTKNPEMLFHGFKDAVKSGYPDLQLTVVSDQPTEYWQEWSANEGLSGNIHFVGPSSWKEIGELMKEHDAFLLTSEYETFSIVLAEAWLTGIPVITTSVGIGANLPSELGVNIAQNDPDSLGNELIRFAKGSYTFDSETIRKHALQFTDEVVLQQLKDTFERFFDLHD